MGRAWSVLAKFWSILGFVTNSLGYRIVKHDLFLPSNRNVSCYTILHSSVAAWFSSRNRSYYLRNTFGQDITYSWISWRVMARRGILDSLFFLNTPKGRKNKRNQLYYAIHCCFDKLTFVLSSAYCEDGIRFTKCLRVTGKIVFLVYSNSWKEHLLKKRTKTFRVERKGTYVSRAASCTMYEGNSSSLELCKIRFLFILLSLNIAVNFQREFIKLSIHENLCVSSSGNQI